MAMIEMPLEELRVYQGTNPRPADFDAYWQEALAELDATGLEYQSQAADFKAKGAQCSDLYFKGTRGAGIHCTLMMPEQMTAPVPGIVLFHSYYGNTGSWAEKLHFVTSLGCAVLAMDVRGQGGLSEDVVGGNETLYGQIVRGVEAPDPKALFYRDVYLDAVKAVRVLMSMDEVDENRIAVHGPSQGGALTVVAAALEPRVKLAAPVYPFLSDFKRLQEMGLFTSAYDQFTRHFRFRDPLHERENAFYERLGYIDIQHFAPRIKADVLWFMGFKDDICPPSTQFAAYNKIESTKEMLIYFNYTHEPLLKSADKVYNYFCKL